MSSAAAAAAAPAVYWLWGTWQVLSLLLEAAVQCIQWQTQYAKLADRLCIPSCMLTLMLCLLPTSQHAAMQPAQMLSAYGALYYPLLNYASCCRSAWMEQMGEDRQHTPLMVTRQGTGDEETAPAPFLRLVLLWMAISQH